MKEFNNLGIIISGQPRSGKSTLANVFSKNSKFNVLKTDILFIKYLKDNKKIFNCKIAVRNFLNSFRYQDSEKKEKRYVREDISVNDRKLIDYVKKKKISKCELITTILEGWNYFKNKKIWVAPDLNAEIYLPKLIKIEPNIKFIFVFRNPVESIVASLYWRKNKTNFTNLTLIKLIIRWNLTFHLAHRLKKKYSSDVAIIFFENLKKNKSINLDEIQSLNYKIKFPYDKDKIYYSYDTKRGWYTPKKRWKIVINNFQLDLIKSGIFSRRYRKKIKVTFTSFCYLFLIYTISFLFIFLASINLNIYKQSVDFLFSPIKSIKNLIFR